MRAAVCVRPSGHELGSSADWRVAEGREQGRTAEQSRRASRARSSRVGEKESRLEQRVREDRDQRRAGEWGKAES